MDDVSNGDAVVSVGWNLVAIGFGGVLARGPRVGQSCGVGADGCGDAGMKLAVLFVAGYFAAGVAAKRDLVSSDGGELVDA